MTAIRMMATDATAIAMLSQDVLVSPHQRVFARVSAGTVPLIPALESNVMTVIKKMVTAAVAHAGSSKVASASSRIRRFGASTHVGMECWTKARPAMMATLLMAMVAGAIARSRDCLISPFHLIQALRQVF